MVRITVLVTDTTAPSIQQGEGLLIITIIDVNEEPPVSSLFHIFRTVSCRHRYPLQTVIIRQAISTRSSALSLPHGTGFDPSSEPLDGRQGTASLSKLELQFSARMAHTLLLQFARVIFPLHGIEYYPYDDDPKPRGAGIVKAQGLPLVCASKYEIQYEY